MEINIRKNKTYMVGVRLTEEQQKQVKDIAKKEKVSVSEICRALIEGALVDYYKNQLSEKDKTEIN